MASGSERYSAVACVSVALQWRGKSFSGVTMARQMSGVTIAWKVDQWRYNGVASVSVALQWRGKCFSSVTMAWQVSVALQ